MVNGAGKVLPIERVEQETSGKLPQADTIVKNGTPEESDRDSSEKITSSSDIKETGERGGSSSNSSVAYLSETLIMKITKQQRLDLIKSLTIHLPKDDMNKKIKYIENLEKLKKLQSLNLSDNMIEKMQKLESLVELKELNLANNYIKMIECVDNLVKLQVLNLSGNQITSIPGPGIKKLRYLKVLKLSHNKLETLLDITRLRPLQDLTNVDLQGNPFTNLPHYRQFVIFQLRSLDILDNQAVTKEERLQANQRFAQEEVRRLELEIAKQEKLYQNVQCERNEAKILVENLTKTQNALKAKEAKHVDRIKELERDIEAKNGLLKAKNSDLIKASEKQYRLEQELAFYKLDAKFEMLGEMPVVDDAQVDEEQGLDDSTYIGKATFKANKFIQESNFSSPEQIARMKAFRIKYEEDKKLRDHLDRESQDKRQRIMQLQEQLDELTEDVDEKNDQLRTASEKLASVELSLASQMATLGQGNEEAKNKLEEKIQFIKRLQAAAEEIERRMEIVANDVAEKQKEVDELRQKAERSGMGDDAQFDLHRALGSKQAELRDAYGELSKMKENLEMLKNRIAEEQAHVEILKKQLGKGVSMSEEAIGQLKQELEEVVEGLNQRLAESRKQTREMEARIHDLEKERDLLGEKLSKRNSIEGEVDGLQRQLDDATSALEDERNKCQDLKTREKELLDRLSALEKNSNLDLIEARSKLRHADEETESLRSLVRKLEDQIENERKVARTRVQRDQERVAKALEAARKADDKEKEMRGLALQVNALKATNEALNDRLEEAENDLRKTEKDSADEDLLVHRLNDLLNDLNNRNKKVKQPEDQTDGVGQRLADVHKKYLELVDELEKEKQHGNLKQKQAKATIDALKAELAQVQSQLNAAESALAQLSSVGAEHEADLKDLEDEVNRLQEKLRSALDKAEDEGNKRARDKIVYGVKIQALEDEIRELKDELEHQRDQECSELNQMRALAGKQKDRLENEIQELQDELQNLKDKHWKELKRKDENVAELEALLHEKEKLLRDEKDKNANDLHRELEKLRRLVSNQTRATQDAVHKELEMKRTKRELEETRRRVSADLTSAENKIRHLEKLLNAKDQQIQTSRTQSLENDHTVEALSQELEFLRKVLAQRDRELASAVSRIDERTAEGDIATPKTRHHIYTHSTPVNPSLQQTVVHHHHDNTSVNKQTREYTVARDPGEVSTRPAVDQVHHHHHYGNGDITSNLKKKKPRKKDYCNISDHEDLEDDVMNLEEKLATANSELSSQRIENKLNILRSDLQHLEHTVSDSFRHRSPMKGLESHLDETLARFQDHLLTLVDHRTNLMSQKK